MTIFRRVYKWGYCYTPSDGKTLHIGSGDEDHAQFLKNFCRIFMGAISSLKSSYCLVKLANFEYVIREHLLSQSDVLPQPTVAYMKSWGDGPMIQHWNLYALEMQLHHPDPTRYVPLKIDLINQVLKLFSKLPNTDQLQNEINVYIDKSAALVDKCERKNSLNLHTYGNKEYALQI